MMKRVMVLLFIVFIFLRFWDIPGRMQFTWDQVQNAWVMKDMIIDHKIPLEGMVAKLNSGFHIGPAYYYLLVPFYWIFHLDPIAAGVFAGIVAVLTALGLFITLKKLFSVETALAGLAIYTFSARAIVHDRIAWPVVFIPVTSLLIFYFLTRCIEGKTKFLPYLAFMLGFSLHIHFTAIFFFLIVFLCLPFLLKTKYTKRQIVLSVSLFLIWLIPFVLAGAQNGFTSGSNLLTYVQANNHGFHFMRVYQLLGDAFIEFDSVIGIAGLHFLKYVTLPIFIFLYFVKNGKKNTIRFCTPIALWFLVPLIVFSLYKGEITDYYFALTRPIVVLVYAYITVELLRRKKALITLLLVLFWSYFVYINQTNFWTHGYSNLPHDRAEVHKTIDSGGSVNFTEGDPKSYLYYIYGQNKQ